MADIPANGRRIHFDWTVNLGHLITAGTLVFGGTTALLWNHFSLQAVQSGLVKVETELWKVIDQAGLRE